MARFAERRIHPVTSVFYADPFVDMHNRMKEALVVLGRLPRAVVRHRWSRSGMARSRAFARRWWRQGLLVESGKRLEAA